MAVLCCVNSQLSIVANVMSRKMGIREDYRKNMRVGKQFGHKMEKLLCHTPGLKSLFATECAQSIIFVVQKSSGCADPKVTYLATNLAII